MGAGVLIADGLGRESLLVGVLVVLGPKLSGVWLDLAVLLGPTSVSALVLFCKKFLIDRVLVASCAGPSATRLLCLVAGALVGLSEGALATLLACPVDGPSAARFPLGAIQAPPFSVSAGCSSRNLVSILKIHFPIALLTLFQSLL